MCRCLVLPQDYYPKILHVQLKLSLDLSQLMWYNHEPNSARILPRNASIPRFQAAFNRLVIPNLLLNSPGDINNVPRTLLKRCLSGAFIKLPSHQPMDRCRCRSVSEIPLAFTDELEKRFQPFDSASPEDLAETMAFINAPSQNALPISHVSPEEVCLSPEHFYSMLRIHHFPSQWKCAVISMLPKPGNRENLVESYRPISLLPTFSKIFEKIFLSRIMGVRSVKDWPFLIISLVIGNAKGPQIKHIESSITY